jgi:pimeloyl-ACP methyl ester carboxylesterase
MRKYLAWAVVLLVAFPAAAFAAPDISGTWQGADRNQHVLKIRKSPGGFRGDFYNLGEEASGSPRNGNTISVIAFDGGSVKFSLDDTGGTFEGKLADDGKAINGTWQPEFGPAGPLNFERATKQAAWVIDPSPHKVRFVTAQKGVKLEVLDWGGSGPPLLFLSGLGNTAHVFDTFALKFTDKHHVYGMTRRGFGLSSAPPFIDDNYDSDRLGDDVLAVIDALKLNRPVVAGHSIAGEELSSVGTRHPEKVGGLIYLDAIFQYSFYNPAQADLSSGTSMVRRDLDQMFELQNNPAQWRALIAEVQAAIPDLQKSLQQTADQLAGAPEYALSQVRTTPEDEVGNRINTTTRKYGVTKVPTLAILAMPRACQPNCDKPFMQKIMADDAARADYFEKESPNARVVRLPNASHYIWRSNEADVEREMNAFMDGLPKS